MLKHIAALLLLAAGITQAANYEISYLQERSDGKKVWRSLVLTPGTYLSVDSVTGQLQVRSISQVRADLSITNVENIALSTWAGSTNLTTLAPNAARNNLTAGTGALNLSLYTLTLPSDVSRLGADIDLGTTEAVGTLPLTKGGTGSTTASGAFGNIKQPASTSATGVVQIATNPEVQTGTDSLKAVVASSLAAWWTWVKTQVQTWTADQTFSGQNTFNGGVGEQLRIGKTGYGGRISLARPNDGSLNAYIGYNASGDVTKGIGMDAYGGSGFISFNIAGVPKLDVDTGNVAANGAGVVLRAGVPLIFEGATDDANETTLTVTDPTADRTVTIPNSSGTVALLERDQTFTGSNTFGDASTDLFTIAAANPTAPNAYIYPSWPGATGSPGATTFMTRDAVRNDILDPTFISFVEEFGTGNTTSGSIGQLGWNTTGTGSIENSTGLPNLPGGLHLRTSPTSSGLGVYAAYLGNTPTFRGGSFLSSTSGGGELRTVVAVGTLNVIDTVSWSYTLGRDGNPPVFDKVTPPNSIGVRYIPYAGTAWAGSTAYSVGANVRPVTANGYKYICTSSGTSGGTEPTWPTTLKGTVIDGTATWTCAGANGDSGSKLQFFVTGANAETSITVGTSTVSGSTNSRITLRVRTVGGNAYFSANGEPEVVLAMPAGSFGMFPAFNVRNDANTPTPDLSIYTWRAINSGSTY